MSPDKLLVLRRYLQGPRGETILGQSDEVSTLVTESNQRKLYFTIGDFYVHFDVHHGGKITKIYVNQVLR